MCGQGLVRGQSVNGNVWARMSSATDEWLLRSVWDQRVSRVFSGVRHWQRRVCVCDCDEVRCPVFLQGPVTQGFHQSLPPLPPFCCPLTPLILSHPSSATFLNQTSCPLFFFVVISSPSTPSNTGILINFFMFLTFLPCPRLAFIFARVFLFSSSSSSLPRLSHHTCPHHPIL